MSSGVNVSLIVASLAASWVVGIAIHELGHALAGRLAGLRLVACGIGFRPWWYVSFRGINFYIGSPLSGGLTLYLNDDVDQARGRLAAMIAGGPLANLLTLAGTAWLWQGGLLPGIAPELCVISGLLALCGLLPFSFQRKTGTFRSDALLFAQLCRGTNHKWADSGVHLGTQLFLRDVFRRLHCLPGVVDTTAGAALFHTLLDDHEQAAALLSDESLCDSRRGREGVVLESFARTLLAFSTDASDFAEVLAAARQACEGKTAAMISLDLIEAAWQHRRGLNGRAIAAQAIRASHQAALPALEAAAQSLFLQIEAPADFADQCRSLAARKGARSLTEEGRLELLAVAARICAESGDDGNAREFFAKALEAVGRIATHIPIPKTQEQFLKSKGAVLRAAANAGDGVPAFIPQPSGPQRSRVVLARIARVTLALTLAILLGLLSMLGTVLWLLSPGEN